jgi:hypothetical protein
MGMHRCAVLLPLLCTLLALGAASAWAVEPVDGGKVVRFLHAECKLIVAGAEWIVMFRSYCPNTTARAFLLSRVLGKASAVGWQEAERHEGGG